VDFCSACKRFPYHLGFGSCEAFAAWAQRPSCIFCDDKSVELAALLQAGSSLAQAPCGVCDVPGTFGDMLRLSSGALRRCLQTLGVGAAGACIERSELEQLARSVRLCAAPACRERLAASCLRPLACGHLCVGCAGEPRCPPCRHCVRAPLHASGPAGAGRGGQPPASCPICAEPIPPGPAVVLQCGHAVHAACLAGQLGAGGAAAKGQSWRPPQHGGALSFEFRSCPTCRARIGDLDHPAEVAGCLRRASQLEADVGARALKRLRADPRRRADEAIQPGGAYEGRPRAYAMRVYSYYLCGECNAPYFGGERRCEAQAGPAAQVGRGGDAGGDPGERRVCGGCAALRSGVKCTAGHDPSFVEWKCKYCCSVASWFCWGTTHMCDRCHDDVARRPKPCLGPGACEFANRHPPNGSSTPFCFGCSLCRHAGD